MHDDLNSVSFLLQLYYNYIILSLTTLNSVFIDQRGAAASSHSTLIISVTVSVLIFFTIGFVCGCVCQKYKQSILALCKTRTDQSSTDLNIMYKQEESQTLEMTENVAYGPVGGLQVATH